MRSTALKEGRSRELAKHRREIPAAMVWERAGKSLTCHSSCFPETQWGREIQEDPILEGPGRTVRGTDGETKLGRPGLRTYRQRAGEEGQAETVQRW